MELHRRQLDITAGRMRTRRAACWMRRNAPEAARELEDGTAAEDHGVVGEHYDGRMVAPPRSRGIMAQALSQDPRVREQVARRPVPSPDRHRVAAVAAARP